MNFFSSRLIVPTADQKRIYSYPSPISPDATQWLDECFALMDRANARSRGKRWKREDLYDV